MVIRLIHCQQWRRQFTDKVVLLTRLAQHAHGGCSLLAAYRRVYGSSPSAWSKGWYPSGTLALHSWHEPGELTQMNVSESWWQHHKHCPGIIIIVISTILRAENYVWFLFNGQISQSCCTLCWVFSILKVKFWKELSFKAKCLCVANKQCQSTAILTDKYQKHYCLQFIFRLLFTKILINQPKDLTLGMDSYGLLSTHKRYNMSNRQNVSSVTTPFLLLARYVPNVAKEELWDQCKK